MKFIGQERIWRELLFLIPEMQAGRNFNILFRASSGCGKTKLAIIIANTVNENDVSYVLAEPSGISIPNTRIIIIDEIHLLDTPEILYPLMDSGNHIILLCSNEYGELKEPLTNRCIDFIFDPYSDDEIAEIIRYDFLNKGVELSDPCLLELALNSNRTPRIARQLVNRLSIVFKSIGIPDSPEQIRQILFDYFQIENGLNPLHRRYLEFISKVKRASLDSISYATRIDKNTIRREIEPVLVEKSYIRITSKGRQYEY